MDRFAASNTPLFLVACLSFCSLGFGLSGCSRESQPQPADSASSDPVGETTAVNASTEASPADVVSQFLDEIRRGGEDTRANELLTDRARAELERIGQTVQPIGSPDARFEVTRYERLPDEPASALVHSVWSEPNGDGTNSDFQVVWAVHKQGGNWRISGLAMELQPGEDPMVIDFENGELMAKLLAVPEETGDEEAAAPTQAEVPGEAVAR